MNGHLSGVRRPCNHVCTVVEQGKPVGILAMSLDDRVRSCVVLAIHVVPSHFAVFPLYARKGGILEVRP